MQNDTIHGDKMIPLGEKVFFKSDYGPVSFGWVTSASIVSWSGKDSDDLLINQLGRGFHLYPTKRMSDEELCVEPVRVCGMTPEYLPYEEVAVAADWNRDGSDDLITAGMTGFAYYLERKGEFPGISFEHTGPLMDEKKKLLFNIPYDNPEHPVMNNLGGYFDTAFFNYPAPVRYDPACTGRINLIIGDWAGNLWWLPDLGDGRCRPVYEGVSYTKDASVIESKKGKELVGKFGCEYVKPAGKICDERGRPFLLGDGYDSGLRYSGGVTRPVLYINESTGSYDILVLAGTMNPRFYYLQHKGSDCEGKPVFINCGEVKVAGTPDSCFNYNSPVSYLNYHSKAAVYSLDGWNDIIISAGTNHMAVLKNARTNPGVPEFRFSHFVSGKNVFTSGYNFVEILENRKTKTKYLLDIPNHLELRELQNSKGEVRLSSEKIPLKDKDTVISFEGETDPQLGSNWGFHRAARWDFDGSGRQHLIAGTDRGLLYLLIETPDCGDGGIPAYKTAGPLKDCEGKVIKIHNRACAAGIDLNGDGLEDLVAGGATYQLGVNTDPNPGGGYYCIINKGTDDSGLPVLECPKPLEITGHIFNVKINHHVHIQVKDIDRDGEKEVLLGTADDNYKGRIFKVTENGVGLRYTGRYLQHFVIDHYLLDVDGDGCLEHVFAGGEEGVGYYRKLGE